MTLQVTAKNENALESVTVVVDAVRIEVILVSGAIRSTKESDREAWKHNELSPPLSSGEHVAVAAMSEKRLLRDRKSLNVG